MVQKHTEPAKLITLLEVFEGRSFEIPDYQRGYSWETMHIEALLNDIEKHNSRAGNKHFMGTIVIERPARGDKYQVVDGQQRLVTCLMILRAIIEQSPCKLKEIESILYNKKVGYESALILSGQDQDYFQKSILNGSSRVRVKVASNKKIKDGYNQIKSWLEDNKKLKDEIYNKLVNDLGFILFETTSDKETTTMFEVINNRGKALSELEKFKNYFLHLCNLYDFEDLRKKIKVEWLNILNNLEKANIVSVYKENQFIRNAFSIVIWKVNKTTDDLYSEYKESVEDRFIETKNNKVHENLVEEVKADISAEISNYIDLLITSAKAYAHLYNKDGDFNKTGGTVYSAHLDIILKKLRNHGTEKGFMPLFLSLMYLYFTYPSKASKINECLEIVEKLNFRVFCLPKFSSRDSKKSDFIVEYAQDIFYGRILSDDSIFDEEFDQHALRDEFYDTIKKRLKNIIKEHCPEPIFVKNLTVSDQDVPDFEKWSSLNFFLSRYEAFLRKEDPDWDFESLVYAEDESEGLTKEHILAIKNKSLFPSPKDIEKRRLGNFILVTQSLNNQLSTKDVSVKVKIIGEQSELKYRLKHIQEVLNLYNEIENRVLSTQRNTINRKKEIIQELFDRRETNMIKFALKEWAYPGEPKTRFVKVDSLQAIKDKRNSRYYPDYDKLV